MKRKLSVILLLTVLLTVTVFSGCGKEKYRFVAAENGYSVDIWKEIQQTGGVDNISIEMNADGSGEIYVIFTDTNVNIEGRIADLNLRALDSELDYNNGHRVIVVKKTSVKSGKLHATLYFQNISHLGNRDLKLVNLGEYDGGDSLVFYNKSGEPVSLRNLKSDDSVLLLDGMSDNMKITVNGKILAASEGFVQSEFKKNSIRYVREDCVLVFRQDHSGWILWTSVGLAVFLVVLFLVLIKFRVFTKMKLKKAKR